MECHDNFIAIKSIKEYHKQLYKFSISDKVVKSLNRHKSVNWRSSQSEQQSLYPKPEKVMFSVKDLSTKKILPQITLLVNSPNYRKNDTKFFVSYQILENKEKETLPIHMMSMPDNNIVRKKL